MNHPATRDQILAWLREVPDPELPTVDIVGLGIVRDVRIEEGTVLVVVTPTFTGCPAKHAIETDIVACLESHGIENSRVATVLAPAWSTDDLEDGARRQLCAAGIAPPPDRHAAERAPQCPRCNGPAELQSRFGATPCKSLWRCTECREPFEAMKAL